MPDCTFRSNPQVWVVPIRATLSKRSLTSSALQASSVLFPGNSLCCSNQTQFTYRFDNFKLYNFHTAASREARVANDAESVREVKHVTKRLFERLGLEEDSQVVMLDTASLDSERA